MVYQIVWIIPMKRIVMLRNVREINMSSVQENNDVHDEKIHIDVMESSIVRIIPMKNSVEIVMEINKHFFVIQNVRHHKYPILQLIPFRFPE